MFWWENNDSSVPGMEHVQDDSHLPTIIYIEVLFWLVVYLPLWKIWKSVGIVKFPIYGKIKHVPNHQPVFIGVTFETISINVWQISIGSGINHSSDLTMARSEHGPLDTAENHPRCSTWYVSITVLYAVLVHHDGGVWTAPADMGKEKLDDSSASSQLGINLVH